MSIFSSINGKRNFYSQTGNVFNKQNIECIWFEKKIFIKVATMKIPDIRFIGLISDIVLNSNKNSNAVITTVLWAFVNIIMYMWSFTQTMTWIFYVWFLSWALLFSLMNIMYLLGFTIFFSPFGIFFATLLLFSLSIKMSCQFLWF